MIRNLERLALGVCLLLGALPGLGSAQPTEDMRYFVVGEGLDHLEGIEGAIEDTGGLLEEVLVATRGQLPGWEEVSPQHVWAGGTRLVLARQRFQRWRRLVIHADGRRTEVHLFDGESPPDEGLLGFSTPAPRSLRLVGIQGQDAAWLHRQAVWQYARRTLDPRLDEMARESPMSEFHFFCLRDFQARLVEARVLDEAPADLQGEVLAIEGAVADFHMGLATRLRRHPAAASLGERATLAAFGAMAVAADDSHRQLVARGLEVVQTLVDAPPQP